MIDEKSLPEHRRLRTKWQCLAASLLWNGAVALLFRVFMCPVFETNDDMAIMGIVNGTRGVFDVHVIQHFLLGMLYRSLYRITTSVSWYSVCQYLFLMLSFTAITYVLLQRCEGYFGLALSLVITAFFGTQCYASMQFTKAAGMLTAAGIFLLYHAAWQDGRFSGSRFLEWIFGLFLTLTGSMYRFDAFASTAALMSGIGIFLLFSLLHHAQRGTFRRVLLTLVAFGTLFFAAFFLRKENTRFYNADQRWADYLEYNDARAQLQDYELPDYEKNRTAMEEMGVSEEAYMLLGNWNQYDPDVLDTGTLQQIAALQTQRKMDLSLLVEYFRTIPGFFAGIRMCYCFLIVFILMLYVLIRSKDISRIHFWISLIWEAAAFLALYFYLYYRGRYTVERIAVGYWMAVILFAAWVLADSSGRVKFFFGKKEALAVGIVSFAFYQGYWFNALPIHRKQVLNKREVNRSYLETMGADKEHLYLRKTALVLTDDCFGPFDAQPEGVLDNQGTLGGWICSVPVQQEILASYGVVNPYRDMVDNDKVLLVDDHIDSTLRYIREQYAPSAEAEETGKIGKAGIYRIVTDSGEDQNAEEE